MEDFLNTLFAEAVADNQRLCIFTLPDRRARHFSSLTAAALYATGEAKSKDVYFGVGLAGANFNRRNAASEIVAIVGLWADIDLAAPWRHSKPLPRTLEEARSILDKLPLAPSVLVDSGHGLHAYWLFKEPWVFDAEHVPGTAGVPDVPRVPRVPDMSQVADVPGVPRVPDVPQVGEMAQVADMAGVAGVPDVPRVQDMADVRDVPRVPQVADMAGVPDVPHVPQVGDMPRVPRVPDVPRVQEMADVRDVPRVAGVPRVPDVPQVAEMPHVAGLRAAKSVPERCANEKRVAAAKIARGWVVWTPADDLDPTALKKEGGKRSSNGGDDEEPPN